MIKLKAGRISNAERFFILTQLGKIAQQKYNDYLLSRAGNYNLQKLRNSLKFLPVVKKFDNKYWIDTGNEELTKVAYYFEYGTGIFNTTNKKAARTYIYPRSGPYLIWRDKNSNRMIFAKRTKGVRPIFMMTTAVAYIRQNREVLIRRIRLKYFKKQYDQGDQDD